MKIIKIFLLAFLAILIFSCKDENDSTNSYQFEQKEQKSIAIDTQTKLSLQCNNGNIKITGSDTASFITFNVTKRVSSSQSKEHAQANISNIDIDYTTSPGQFTVFTDHPLNNDLSYSVDFEIILPKIFDYYINLGNGNINLEANTSSLLVELGNGNLQADVILLDDCSVNMNAGNGNMIFTIPNTTNAFFDVSVGNGLITETGMTFQNLEKTKTTLKGTSGNGSGNVSMTVGNGNVEIMGY
jgi:hypothetical protein